MGLDPAVTGGIVVAALFVLMMIGVPIVYSLGVAGILGALLGYGVPALQKAGASPFSTGFQPFVDGAAAVRAAGNDHRDRRGWVQGCSGPPANWLSRVRGGLVAAGIIGEGVLAATLGTSAATIIVVGKVAVPEFDRQGYDRGYGLGALLAGGALGPLIPPSATFIIVGVIAGLSIGKLFIAGIIPGIILIAFLAIPAIVMAYLRPGLAPEGIQRPVGREIRALSRESGRSSW